MTAIESTPRAMNARTKGILEPKSAKIGTDVPNSLPLNIAGAHPSSANAYNVRVYSLASHHIVDPIQPHITQRLQPQKLR